MLPPTESAAIGPQLRRLGIQALDLLLPPRCVTCDTPVTTNGQFCGACFGRLVFISDPFCRQCGLPFRSVLEAGADRVCPDCQEGRFAFGEARAAFRYDAAARRLILPFKHGDRTDLAGVLARPMARAGAALLARADRLVPVPLHRTRLFQRKYNQAGLLAQAVGHLASRPVLLDALVRTRPTTPMGHRGAVDRAAEVRDAFAVRRRRQSLVRGQHLLLIDDVMTSGATVDACARALLRAGAMNVDVLVAARVPNPGIDQDINEFGIISKY